MPTIFAQRSRFADPGLVDGQGRRSGCGTPAVADESGMAWRARSGSNGPRPGQAAAVTDLVGYHRRRGFVDEDRRLLGRSIA
jgi:hypothetical protein